ncbi:metal ABC transporter ATP-binding protein [Dongia deserti]|uniref:metal ABC transporter ATP-binding protein n=1 Tax=Dongia deserti TaxID=2268030 RepID=UPI000E6579A0|nr:ABC transporter ATP-binding protein [Dongia deserti]
MGRGLVGNPIEAALSRAAPHESRPWPASQAQPVDVLRLDDVTIAYDRHPVVHHISGAFEGGSLTALVGPNGAGKSTLLKAIAGLLPVTAGAIRFGIDRGAVAYLPQVVDVDRSFPLRVVDVVDFGHWRKVGALRRLSGEDRAVSVAAIASVGLAGLEHQPIGKLSVGQFQRVLFARLMVQEAALILLDEPFNAIDQKTAADLMNVVRDWQTEGRTVVAALHDLEQVRRDFPDALLMARELVAWGPARQTLSDENLERARHLAASWTDPAAAICAR